MDRKGMMRPVMLTDRRITTTATADLLAQQTFKRCILFIFRGCCSSRAVYILGKRVYARGWQSC